MVWINTHGSGDLTCVPVFVYFSRNFFKDKFLEVAGSKGMHIFKIFSHIVIQYGFLIYKGPKLNV